MGYMDILKNAMGMANTDPKEINQDGKQYTFRPGRNGSLTAPAPAPGTANGPEQPAAKVIPPASSQPIQIASSRG